MPFFHLEAGVARYSYPHPFPLPHGLSFLRLCSSRRLYICSVTAISRAHTHHSISNRALEYDSTSRWVHIGGGLYMQYAPFSNRMWRRSTAGQTAAAIYTPFISVYMLEHTKKPM